MMRSCLNSTVRASIRSTQTRAIRIHIATSHLARTQFTTRRITHFQRQMMAAPLVNLPSSASFSSSTPDATAPVPSTTSSHSSASSRVTAWIAIGGNSGHRARNIAGALGLLQRTPNIQLEATSFLYETTPVGSPEQHRDQPRFLNGALEISTTLKPLELLDALQSIERECGRVRSADGVRNGPRTIDLDILFYESTQFELQHERLELPHPRWSQRGFVLTPMKDLFLATRDHLLLKMDSSLFDKCAKDVFVAWHRWYQSQQSIPPEEQERIYRVIPFPTAEIEIGSNLPALSDVWRYGQPVGNEMKKIAQSFLAADSSTPFPRHIDCPTILMGILNLTPDSFSDGGVHTSSIDSSVQAAKALWDAGADIVDIGGESTRPGATPLTPQQELERIMPVIQGIRSKYPLFKLSVDTYHPSVARAAVQAGCVMINDVCGGTICEATGPGGAEESMLDVAAEMNVPYVCMHIRGTPQTMTFKEHTTYADVLPEVREEQQKQFEAALATRVPCGEWRSPSSSSSSSMSVSVATPILSAPPSSLPSSILYRWNLIGDPGIGFAKSGAHAVALLRHLPEVRPFGPFPILIGTSRKGFISKTLMNAEHQLQARTSNAPSSSTPSSVSIVDRAWGTAATVTASIQGGADILRVHDVHEMRCVRDVADQIYRI